MKKRKFVVLILLPVFMLSFLSVGYSQIVSDTSLISMGGSDWSLKVDSALASSIDSRNTPYMTAKSSTEKELFLELATLEDCKSGVVQFKIDMQGLTAYKQYPLSQAELDLGNFRPKNVENSFALFDSDGRKVAHIYGSKITDSKGVEVWLDQDLTEGLLTVYLPKPEVIETLSFPLLLDPTFGYTTIGGSVSGDQPSTSMYATKFTLTEAANIQTLHAYIVAPYGSVTGEMAVYNDTAGAPSAFIENTTGVTVPNNSAAWINYTLTGSIIYNAGDYWLASASSGYLKYYYDSGASNQKVQNYEAFTWAGRYPDPFNATSYTYAAEKASFYATYEAYVEPTPTPTATPTPTPFVSATPFPEGAMDDTDWWISILVLLLIIINIFLMMLPFALVRFTFGILSLFLCMLALSYQVPLSPYLQTAGLLISALAMLFSVRARE